MRIAIISDTHMPRGERRVPAPCVEAMRGADLIMHAGDLSDVMVLDWLESLGPPVRAVWGNVDVAAVRARLPETQRVEADGVVFAIVHDAGAAKGRLARMRGRFPDADAVVFGHSHMPLHEAAEGFHIFNPGSPTERRRAPRRSFGMCDTGTGSPVFEHVWL